MRSKTMKTPEKKTEEIAVTAQPNNHPARLGEICLHDNVISNLVRRAALSVAGVSRLAGSSLVDELAALVGSRKIQDRSINVLKDEKDSSKIVIEIKLNTLFGYKVHEVAENVQHAVIEMVENTAGVSVVEVKVIVLDIEDQPPPPEEPPEAEKTENAE